MTFFAFQPPPAIVGVFLVALYFGPYVLPVIRGRPDGVWRGLALQVAIMLTIYLLALVLAPNQPDFAGILLFSALFLPVAGVAVALIRLRNAIAARITKRSHH